MHASLSPKMNIGLSLLWLAISVGISVLSSQPMWASFLFGASLGIIAGALQLCALRQSVEALVVTTTAVEVRRALRSSRAGRLYTYFLWLSTPAIIIFAGVWHRPRDGAPWGMIAGAAAFAFVREIISLPGVFSLKKSSCDAQDVTNVV